MNERVLGVVASLALVTGCASGDLSPETQSRVLPVAFEAMDGTVALAGEYDPEDDTLTLYEDLLGPLTAAGPAVVLEVHSEGIQIEADHADIELPYALEIGDEMSVSAGELSLTLTLEDPSFEPDPPPIEATRASSAEACTISNIQGVYLASWGCALQPVSGVPQDRIAYQIEDYKTDGSCVQLWAQRYNSGAWSRVAVSCGPIVGGSVAKGTFANRVRTLRLFRTNTSSTLLFDPPGRYMTIYSD